jgi:hypothetical protein
VTERLEGSLSPIVGSGGRNAGRLRVDSGPSMAGAWLACLALVSVVVGCAGAPSARSALSSGLPVAGAGRVMVALRAELAAVQPERSAPESASATLEIFFRDAERFEYRLVVKNATIADATLALVDREDGGARIVLATDLAVRGAYVQVRGTGTLAGQPAAVSLVERLRMPRRFRAILSTADLSPILAGQVR